MSNAVAKAWARIRTLGPIVEAHRDEGERLRRLPDATGRAFVEANVPRLLLPCDLGGDEVDPLTYFDMTEELARRDGAAGWNFSLAAMQPTMLGSLPVARLGEIFAQADSGLAGTLMPAGRAAAVDGGFRVSGRWAWASGIHHARWVVGGALILEGDRPSLAPGGVPQTTFFLMPAHEIAILDTWQTGGLRGTGSTEFSADNVFVPSERTFRPFPGESAHEAAIFRMPVTFFGYSFAAVALGIAREALEGLVALATRKTSVVSGALKDLGEARYAVAKSQALLEAHRRNARESFRPIWENMKQRRPIGSDLRARARRAYVAAVEAAQEAVVLCYRAAGGTALFRSEPFERPLRDVFAVSGHHMVRRARMEMAGRVAFGQPADVTF